MSMETGIILIAALLAVGALFATRAGIRSIQSARRVSFFRLRRTYMLAGWRWLLLALVLFSISIASAMTGDSFFSQLVPQAPAPSAPPVPSATRPPAATNTLRASATAESEPSGSLTQTETPAADLTPTETPTATPTLAQTTTPDRSCDRIEVVADVNVPKDSVFAPGGSFTKIWRLKNVGTCTWTTSYRVVLVRGHPIGGQDQMPLPTGVPPGGTIDLQMNFVAPGIEGIYRGEWQLQNAQGQTFNMASTANVPFTVGIQVQAPPATGTVFDLVASACSAQWSSEAGTLSCPGPNRSPDGYVLRQSLSRLEDGTLMVRPSLLTVPQDAQNGIIQALYPPFKVQAGDRFRAIVNCEGRAVNCEVRFRVDYQLSDGVVHKLWGGDETFDSSMTTVNLDLGTLAGQEVNFILTVFSEGLAGGDHALWVEPRIVRSISAAPTTPTPAP